jgi:hypothetical protein
MNNRKTTRRTNGMVVFVGRSRSARFWAAIKANDGSVHFGYGGSFLSSQTPRVGQRVSFAALPPKLDTKYPRAIEVAVVKQDGRVLAIHDDAGSLRLVLRTKNRRDRVLGLLDLTCGQTGC